jgi:DNA-binding NarL/FixJ family response regulator
MKNDGITKMMEVWAAHNKILNPVKKELYLDIIDQVANMFAAGSFYYYVFNFETLEMEFVHEGIKEVLGITPQEFSVPELFEIMHPEDSEMMHKKEQEAINFLLKTITPEEIPLYKVVYLMRLKHTNGKYKTILHQTLATNVSHEGRVQQVVGVHTDLTYLNIPFDHKISFISSKRPSYFSIMPDISMELQKNSFKKIFTARETEIIEKISEGKSFTEIAELLFVSPHTVNTHKKNILRKSHCKNTTELIANCIREGII